MACQHPSGFCLHQQQAAWNLKLHVAGWPWLRHLRLTDLTTFPAALRPRLNFRTDQCIAMRFDDPLEYLEGHLPWNLASITTGSARSSLFCYFFTFILLSASMT